MLGSPQRRHKVFCVRQRVHCELPGFRVELDGMHALGTRLTKFCSVGGR